MSDFTTNLAMPFLAAAQAQKHVTVNEALLRLDALVQLCAVSATTTAQPGSPTDGAIYILPSGKSGSDWGAMATGALAYYRDGVWEAITPNHGWRAYVRDADDFVAYDGAAWTSLLSGGGGGGAADLPTRHISGLLIANNASDANNGIDLYSGKARADSDAEDIVLASTLTKKLNASWAVGSGNGGLDTGSKANSTWYHLWLIKRPDTGVVDALFSTSASSPTMPTNYTRKRHVGAVLTNSSGNIVAFTAYLQAGGGMEIVWGDRISNANDLAMTGSAQLVAMTVPLGLKCNVRFQASTYDTAGGAQVVITSPDEADVATSRSAGKEDIRGSAANAVGVGQFTRRCNTSSQVRFRSAANTAFLVAATRAFTLDRSS